MRPSSLGASVSPKAMVGDFQRDLQDQRRSVQLVPTFAIPLGISGAAVRVQEMLTVWEGVGLQAACPCLNPAASTPKP